MTSQRRQKLSYGDNNNLLPFTVKDKNKPKSLMDEWKERKEQIRNGDARNQAHHSMMMIVSFHVPTYIYVMMTYIIPYFFESYHPWTRYYFKVFLWFIMMNGLVNYLCVMLYTSFFNKTKDNPYLSIQDRNGNSPETFNEIIEKHHTSTSSTNHRTCSISSKDGELDWTYCESCDMNVPPRTHHCRFCKKCVLKRDHHCFIVGQCVGYRNQRYFIVMLFYLLVIGMVGGSLTVLYIYKEILSASNSWLNLIFPINIARWAFGYVDLLETILVTHCYIYFLYILLGLIYFPSQMKFAMMGKTMLEIAKELPIRNTNSWKRNLESVFGSCWYLNFVFPNMVLVFRQTDDGVNWEGVKKEHRSPEIDL